MHRAQIGYRGLKAILAVALLFSIGFTYVLEQDGTEATVNEEPSRAEIDVPYIEDLRYVAIGPERFSESIRPLVEWKTQKGVRAEYFVLDGEDGILEISQGRDVQEKVRNYIIALKGTNPWVKWVLLVGDGEIIPPRRTFVNGSSENGAHEDDNYVMSDVYYAGLTGSWDSDGDNVFGEDDEELSEMDLLAEVYVGRFPASNRSELDIMVNRQLSYEKDPPPGSWTESSLLAGSLMDAPNNKGRFDPYKDNAYELVLKIKDLLPEDVEKFALLDYPRLEWGGYNRMFDTLNATNFIDHFQMGFSTAMLACHGDINGNCTDYKGDSGGKYPYWADYDVYFNYTTAHSIENGARTPLVYISNCDSLNFTEEDDTNMEKLMTNDNGGAIGVIGASVTTYRGEYRDETSWGNWWMARKFFEILYYQTQSPAEALYLLKEQHDYHVNQRTLIPKEERMYYIDNLAYNLLGDPEGPIWIDRPKEFDIEYPSVYYQDNTSFRVTVTDSESNEPVSGSVVTLMDPDDENTYYVTTTDSEGSMEIYFRPEKLDDLVLTVTKEGYIPSTEPVRIESLKNLAVLESITLEPGIPVMGKTLKVNATVVNDGEVPLENVLVRIELSSENRSQTPERHIRDLSPGEDYQVNGLSFDPYPGMNTITVSAVLLSDSLERTTDDNIVRMKVLVNEPVEFLGPLPNVVTDEDTRLSTKGKMVNLSEYVMDPDQYPGPITYEVESLNSNIDGEIVDDHFLDIIPGRDWNGEGLLRIYADDGSDTKYSDLRVVVRDVADPPSFEEWPGSVSGFEGIPFSFELLLRDVDSQEIELRSPTTDDITFNRLSNRTGLVYNVTIIPSEEDVGTSVLTIIAEDDTDQATELRIAMEVLTTNDPPDVTIPERVEARPGEEIRIPLDVFDPDNDKDIRVGVSGSMISSYSYGDGYLIIQPAEGIERGSHTVKVWVNDNGTNGNVTRDVEIEITEGDREPILITFFILVGLIIVVLVTYGIMVRLQESRQRKMLGKVENEVRTSVPGRGRRRRNTRGKKSIAAPPAPENVQRDILKKEISSIEDRELPSTYQDLESDLDEIMEEMYGPRKGGNA